MRRLWRGGSSKASLLFLGLIVLCAVAPSLLAPFDPYQQDLTKRLLGPVFSERYDAAHLLGTDQLGRDVLSRIIHGAQITLLVSALAVAVSAIAGTVVGLFAGYRGGWIDLVIMRIIDMQLAFPVMLLVIAVVAVVGPSLVNLILIMGLSGWPRFARVARGSVLSAKEMDYVDAARAVGTGRWRIMFHHILPNIMSALIVYASFELARMILLEASLSFLGLGVQPPIPTWGGMINDGRQYIFQAWSVSFFPGLAILALILTFNMLGDDLRDALDPRLANE
ncbi:MAG: ABC transporter permease [Alphaproteobacteria bacterium]|nr:ABC transporter permease [Alphaproteobacteria bacterium]